MFTAIGKTFARGLAAVLPVAVTLYVLWWLATTAERSLGGFARWALVSVAGEGYYVPGTGVVLGFALVLIIGMVMRALVVRRVVAWSEHLLERVPLVKTIYGPLRDLMKFVASSDSERHFNQAVRVDFDDGQVSLVGLLTREDAGAVTDIDGDERVIVYLPMSYQIGGYMLAVPRESVTKLDMPIEDVLRMTMTAGMSISPDEDEDEDEHEKSEIDEDESNGFERDERLRPR